MSACCSHSLYSYHLTFRIHAPRLSSEHTMRGSRFCTAGLPLPHIRIARRSALFSSRLSGSRTIRSALTGWHPKRDRSRKRSSSASGSSFSSAFCPFTKLPQRSRPFLICSLAYCCYRFICSLTFQGTLLEITSPGFFAELASDHSLSNAAQSRISSIFVQISYLVPSGLVLIRY